MSKEKFGEIAENEVFIFPTSFAQQRLWFLDQFEPNSPFYNIPAAVKITGYLNVRAIEDTIAEIVFRHESLRTTFDTEKGDPIQVIHPEMTIPIKVMDLSNLPIDEREEESKRLANNEARTPFNLNSGPLFRATLIKLQENEHIMLVTMHHIISDGWSVGVFIREVMIIYQAFSQGKECPLPELPIQYADFSSWQREWLSGEILDQQLAYWKSKLGHNLQVLELPTDKPRPAIQSARGASLTAIIPKDTNDNLIQFTRVEGVTPFMALLAVFNILLYKYSAQEDITVGTPIANRTQSETEALIGFFVNTLVIRSDLTGNPTFKELVKRVRKTTLESYAHQDLPFEMLVENIQPERSMSHSPLFQVMFILQNATSGAQVGQSMQPTNGSSDLKMEQITVDAGTSTFDITVSISEAAEGLNIAIEFCTDLFKHETMVRFLDHYKILLAEVINNPDVPISRLNILSSAEQYQILTEWNDTKTDYNYKQCMHRLFEQHAQNHPEAIAIAVNGTYLNYADLNYKANQLARVLSKRGIMVEQPVGIILEKSLDLAVAVLAVLKAGGGYIPMDPDYPTDRLAHMVEDSNLSLLITVHSLNDRLPKHNAAIIYLDKDAQTIASEEGTNLKNIVGPENMAYMIYTSGTTGKSKGTIITHQSWVNSYYAWEDTYELKTLCRSHLQMANFSFDVFAGDFIRALGSGGKLTFISREVLLSADLLYEQMLQEKITIAEFVPAVLRNLIVYLDKIGKDLSFMRCLIAGSDAWYVGEYKKFLDYGGEQTRLINSFGLTETSIDSTYFEAEILDMPQDHHVPIGKPFANMQVYILDNNLMPAAIGVPGEICIGGAGLARGYHNRPELTAEKFIPHPFSPINGERIYRTGDKGKYLPDGNIEFMGRIDLQIKLRGFRIELGEIESAIGQHPDIRESVVIVREDSPGDKRLVAYFVTNGQTVPESKTLRRFMLEKLPDYMVPNAFIRLTKIPLTPNGKIDRKALPIPDESDFGSIDEYIAPRNEKEEIVVGIWSDILKIEQISVYSNFFDLGGHSLLATQLISRIREKFDMDIPLRNVFEFPTVAALCESIEISQRGQSVVQAPPILAVSRQQELPLSFSQQRLWFLDQLDPESSNYNIPEAARIKGKLEPHILEQAINYIIKRHEVLRTNFVAHHGVPRLLISKDRSVNLEQSDLRQLKAELRNDEAMKIAANLARTVFNLSEGTLLRTALLRLDDEEYIFLATIHHIISDDWSTQIFVREIAVVYEAILNNKKVQLPPLPVQYADFAHWQQNWLKDDILNVQLSYWTKILGDISPILELPTDRPRPKSQTFRGAYKKFEINPTLSHKINTFAKDHGVTTFMTLLAVFETLIYRYSGQDNFNIGTPIANRTRAEIEPLIGFFVNTLVIPADFSGEPTFAELLQRVRETALGAYAHQDVPFEKIVDALQPDRDMSHSPLFQVMFVLQSANANQSQSASNNDSPISISPIEAHSGASKFDITLFMVDDGSTLAGAFEYNTDLFDGETIDRYVLHFEQLLSKLIQHPKLPLNSISLIEENEKNFLIDSLNSIVPEPKITENIKQIFENQVKRQRLTPALFWSANGVEQSLTYQELNAKANRLAHFLIQKGIKNDDLIGVCLNRSPEMIIAIMATIKSGAGYLPLEISYPAERIKYIVTDSDLRLLFTHNAVLSQNNFINNLNVEILNLDELLLPQDETNPQIPIDPLNIVYMIYTSGSTGKPKGTLITHQGLTHYLNWINESYPLEQGRGSLLHSTIAFDATITALFSPILNGKSLTLAEGNNDPEALSSALLKYSDFNIVKITPAHLDLLSSQIPKSKAAQLTKSFVIGGENLTSKQIEFWQKYAPVTMLFNEYGPTETVVGCVVFEAKKWFGSGSVPIGRSIPNSPVYVLDSYLQPVPKGIPGELYIGGKGVARGYHKRPELTAEKFLPDPYAKKAGTRMYRTGDLVRYLNNDQLIFLGRLDTQVKVRGYRIELAEIESAIRQSDNIKDTLVTVREDTPGDKRIIAYLITESDLIDERQLKETLHKILPEYMHPAAFIKIKNLPLTANGKIDYKALPKPEYTREILKQEYIAPQNDIQQKLASIWQSILGIEEIGINDNFFDLGGHSLLATQVISRIRDDFKLELPLKSLFESPTIAGFELALEQAKSFSKDSLPAIVIADRSQDLPLSFAQQRLWFLDQLASGNANYNIPSAFKISGKFDIAIFQKTINEIIRRHETLRTSFSSADGQPFIVITEGLDFRPEIIDLSKIELIDAEKQVQEISKLDATTPFDLNNAPLFRLKIIKLPHDEYAVLFNMHHIISDGWSTNVLLRELSIIYNSFNNNQKNPLKELQIQYVDYAAWQRAWLKGEVLQQQLDFWKNKLGTNPPPLDLATDFQRPALQTFKGNVVSKQISKELTKQIYQVGQKNNTTLFMTMLAVWQTLLHKYSRQETVLSGSPVANRNLSETEALIGFFVNTLVFKSDFYPSLTFTDLLKQIREYTLDAYAHQDVPFEQLVDELQSERTMSRSPLFQVMFVMQNNTGNLEPVGDLQIQPIGAEAQTSKFELTLSIIEFPEILAAELEYNSDLFSHESAEQMLRHYTILLEKLIAHSHIPIAAHGLLNIAEEKLIKQWNVTTTPLDKNSCIHHLFEKTVEQYPHKKALVFVNNTMKRQDTTYTFLKLNQMANKLAHYLISQNVTPESLIGISVERSAEMVIALLAVLKAGAVYVPIDPNYPQERIDYILSDASINVLLTDDKNFDIIKINKIQKINLTTIKNNLASLSDTNPEVPVYPENTAYMIYTSGSTGKPKGTMVQHNSLCNLTSFQIKDFQLNPESRCLQFASFSFDASVSEIFTTLVSGASLYIAPKEQLLPGPSLVSILKNNKITTITLPPSVTAVLKEENFPDLRILVSAGELLPADLANHWRINRRMINAYGPTENTVCASSYVISEKVKTANVPIGKAIHNNEIYILDDHLNILPIGIPGELYISGYSLARGYHKQPDLTAGKFIPNPFSSSPGERLYRTADLARYLPDGNIEFLRRIDDQVKLRGYRIELGEITNTILLFKGISNATAIIREDIPGSKTLVAYYIAKEEEINPEELSQFLKKSLPDFMVPSTYVKIDAFPLTPNGKIDQRALPIPAIDRTLLKAEFVAPRNQDEQKMAAIWKEILHRDNIGVFDNFFESGGHSLIATQLVSRIKKVFNVTLELRFIFELPTIAELCIKILEMAGNQSDQEKIPITLADRTKQIPLSFAQQRLWFLDQLVPGSAMYNLPSIVELKGNINTDILAETLKELAIRHEILRTTFHHDNGRAYQKISKDANLGLNIINLQHLKTDKRLEQAKTMAANEIMQPFDLQSGPLLRSTLFCIDSAEYIFVLNMHHIISDGWSMGILVQEIAAIYSMLVQNKKIELKELKYQYADFTVWQRAWLTGQVLQKQIDFWKGELQGTPALLNLPLDRPRPGVQTYNGHTISFASNSDIAASLYEFNRSNGLTSFMTLLAAFQVLLSRYSGQQDIAVGTPIANRNHAEFEPLIGFFVNTLVIRGDLSEKLTFTEFVKQIRQKALAAFAHQDIPFETVVDAVAKDRAMSYSPLFQVMFVLQNTPQIALTESSDFSIKPMDGESSLAKFDITLTLMDSQNGISGSLEYNTDLFNASTMHRMMNHYEKLLSGLISAPDIPVTQIPLVDDSEIRQILNLQNQAGAIYEKDMLIHQLFEQAVNKYPDKIALTFEERSLSYHELNAQANQLAHYLDNQGIKAGDLVGLTIERNIEMVVSIIAILKTGAAYVPLDPAYPAERLSLIMENSKPAIILTQSKLMEQLPKTDARIISIDQCETEIKQQSKQDINTKLYPLNTAYIIYTSGSTGKPKGVMVSHQNVVRLFAATKDWFNFDSNDVWTFFHSYAFDFSVWELWGALLYGGRIVIVPHLISRTPQSFYNIVIKEGVTVLCQTPAAFQQFAQADKSESKNSNLSLRYIIFGGDTLELQSLKPWFDRHGDLEPQLINMYGITETTVHVTYRPISKIDLINAAASLIGSAIPDLNLYVLDENLNPVPLGVPGELYVGGAGLASGYNRQPGLTVERFIPDPYSSKPGARLYRTGDLGRLLENGDLEYLGRIDNQVQLRGFRVELGEIESTLAKHGSVRETIVLLREDNPGDKKLVAYLVQNPDNSVSITELRQFMQNHVPDYMVPSAFVILENFPLTEHGKINRRILPAPSQERPVLENIFEEAKTDIEKLLVQVWKKVLGVDKIGINDNFFDLGGDSILMIQSIARLKNEGYIVTPTQIFQNPYIKALAAIAITNEAQQAEQGLVTGSVPLTPIQHWFFEHHQDHPQQFNTSMIMELFQPMPADIQALEKTIITLIEHHDILRASFIKEKGSWIQEIDNINDRAPVRVVDLSQLRKTKQKIEIENEAAKVQESFKLNEAPLIRVVYFECGKKANSKLLFVFHHLVTDGVSWRIIVEDFVNIYAQISQNKELKLPAKSTSYKKWAEQLVEYSKSDILISELKYWLKLQSAQKVILPYDNIQGLNTYGSTKALTLGFGVKNTQKLLQDVPKKVGGRINAILLVALIRTMRPYLETPKLLIEMEGHGREEIIPETDLSRTVGWFTSIFPIEISIEGAKGIAEEIAIVNKQLDELPNKGTGFGILKYLHSDPDIRKKLTNLPSADLNFNYLGQFDAGAAAQNNSPKVPFRQAQDNVGPEQHPDDKRSAQLYFVAAVSGGQLHTRWLFSQNVFKDSTIKRISKKYLIELNNIVKYASGIY